MENGEDNHLVILHRIDTRTMEHSKLLGRVLDIQLHQDSHLKGISENTANMASTLSEMHADNRTVLGYMTGKKQVPLAIFLLVVSLLVVMHLVDIVRDSLTSIKISTSGLEINPHDENTPTKKNSND